MSHNYSNFINKIFCKSSENMNELPNKSIHLIVTSPPYNVGKEYDKDLTLEEYLNLVENVMKESFRVLVDGGRVCINVGNTGRNPYIPLTSYITQQMIKLKFLMRGIIIWNKDASAGNSTEWGSWKSASNPVLRDVNEFILIFSKKSFSRNKGKSTITTNEFLEYTKSIWTFSTANAKRIGHPAPFPLELPLRCIKLYSYENDIILDPFIGSGTTAIACKELNRKYVGYDNELKYVKLAQKNLSSHIMIDNWLCKN